MYLNKIDSDLIRDIILYRVNHAFMKLYDVSIFSMSFFDSEKTSIQGYELITRSYIKVEYEFWEARLDGSQPINKDSMIIYKDEYLPLIRQKKMKMLGI